MSGGDDSAGGVDSARLISDQLDGLLDDAGHARLAEWLAADPQHRQRYLRQVLDHQALRRRGDAVAGTRARSPRWLPATRWLPTALLAAGLLASLAGAWWLAGRTESAPAPAHGPMLVAGAGTSVDGATTEGAATLRDGARLVVGASAAELRWPDGTRAVLRPGSDAEIVSSPAKNVRLRTGACDASVVPQRAPMLVATPEAEIAVLGTVLSVATADGETVASVSEGRVAVTRRADGARVEVATGERAVAAPGAELVARSVDAPFGTLHRVGPGHPLRTLADVPPLRPGDVVEIAPGTYREARIWAESGTPLRPIVIRGAAGGALPLIDGTGVAVSGVGVVPRALFQIAGNHVVIERIAFANARHAGEASGIRCVRTTGTVIRGCRIERCDEGIDAHDDDLLVENCQIAWCGAPERDGYTHGIYVAGAAARIVGCVIRDSTHGQALKAETARLSVRHCRIERAEDGEVSVIGSAGGDDAVAELVGNVLVAKPGRRGNRVRFIETTAEGGERGGTLRLAWNTCVAADPHTVLVSTRVGSARLVLDNNLLLGSDLAVDVGAGGATGAGNWVSALAALPPTVGVAGRGDPGLDAALRPAASAACAGRAVAASDPPTREPPAADGFPANRAHARDPGAFAAP